MLLSSPRPMGGVLGVSKSFAGASEHALEHLHGSSWTADHGMCRLVNWVPLKKEGYSTELVWMWGHLGNNEEMWEAFAVGEKGERVASYWIKKFELKD